MAKLIWTGPRESDKEYTGGLFSGAVTLYGGRKRENKSFCLTKDYRINHNHGKRKIASTFSKPSDMR